MDTNSSSNREPSSNDDETKVVSSVDEEKVDETIRNTKLNSLKDSNDATITNTIVPSIIENVSNPTITLNSSKSSPNIFYPKSEKQVSNNFHHHQQVYNNTTIFDTNHPPHETSSIELQQVSNSVTFPIPLHQTTNQTNVQSTRNGHYSSLADNSFSSSNMPSSTSPHPTINHPNTNVEPKQTLRQRAFSNVKLISPRKRLKQSPSVSSFQTSSDSWDNVKENRKELEELFGYKRRSYPSGSTKNCCYNFWNALYYSICPVNRISNILLFVVILHTLVCIIATTVILYSAGEQSVQETTRLNNMNLVQEMVQYLDVATKSSTELSMLFTVQSKYYNDTTGNGTFIEPITRFSTVVAPKLFTYSTALAMIYYGNDNGDFAFAERRSVGSYLYLSQSIFKSQFNEIFKKKTVYSSNSIYVLSTNDYFEPSDNSTIRILYNSTYDPRVRPWYTATDSLEKGKPVWSNVFVDVNGNLSIAASLVLSNLNSITPSYKEVIGVHMIFDKIQSYLLNLYSYTNNMMILMENSGNLLTSNENTFPMIYSNYSRVNISYFTSATKFSTQEKKFWGLTDAKLDLMEKISNVMVSNDLLDKRFSESIPCSTETFQATQVGDIPDQFCILNRFVVIKQYNTSTSFVSVSRLVDACGMDFYFIVSRNYYSFADVLVDHYVGLLVVLCVTVLIGTLAVLALTSCISYSLFFVSRKLFYISKLRQEEKPKQTFGLHVQRAVNNIFYEIHTLQKCLDVVERANSSFVKYIPKSVVKFIVEGSSSAKLGMINAEITIVFTDLANFTNISEALSIHNLLLVISRYFEVVTSNVQECGGIIDKYIGDGCMALFNTPYQPITHHAEHAAKAAIKIVKGLKKLNKELEEIYKMKLPTEVSARVGINTGSALIGNIGTHDRLNFTAVGDCVNVSSRLESLNRMYGTKILIGEGSVATFKGIEKIRGDTKEYFSTILDQREFSLSDLAQKMMNLVEYQVTTSPKPRESIAHQSSTDLGKEMSFSSVSNLKMTSTSSSQDTSLPQIVTYFIDTICLKGKNQPVPVFAVQCDRKLATVEQIYIEKMLDLVRRELLEEKRLKDVIHLLRSLILFFEENQLTDSPVFREHNTDHYGFKFGDDIRPSSSSTNESTINNGEKTEEEVSTIIEGDPYPVIYKAIIKLKERLEATILEHEAKKRKTQTNKKHHLLTALSIPIIDTRSKSDPLIHPMPIIPEFSTTSLLDENVEPIQLDTLETSESTPSMAKYEYYRQMSQLEKENRRTSMKLDDFALRLHEK